MPRRKPREKGQKNPQRNTPRPQNEEPVTQATPEARPQNAPNPVWREIKKTAGRLVSFLAYASAGRLAWDMWLKNTQPNCYGHVANDVRYKIPGGIAGQRAQQPYACPGVIDGMLADGFQKPLAYAADGCSVKCPPQSDPVYVVAGNATRDILGLPFWRGTDFHLYIADSVDSDKEKTLKETKNNEADLRIYSHKPGVEESPRNYDGSRKLITCPPKSDHHYTRRDPIIPLIRDTADYKPCGYVCSLPRGAAIKDSTKKQNDPRGR